MDAAHTKRIQAAENIEVLPGTEVISYEGLDLLEGINVRGPDASERKIVLDGIFLAIGWQPNTAMLELAVDKTSDGYLKTDAKMMTSWPGLFAAGDVRQTDMWQVLTACADGARAALHASEFLR